MQNRVSERRELHRKSAPEMSRRSPSRCSRVYYLAYVCRKLPKPEGRTLEWITKDDVQCSHRTRNIACSHWPNWKNS